jgi:hypothetical protein
MWKSENHPFHHRIHQCLSNKLGLIGIYAIATSTGWKNAITKTTLVNMPLYFFHTSIYAILVVTKPYTANYTCIHAVIRMDT